MFLGRKTGAGDADKEKMASISEKLQALKGKLTVVLTNDNENTSTINFTFNNTPDPAATVKLDFESLREIFTQKSNPINLFMAGRIRLEGDMSLAMSLQAIL